MLVNNNQVNPPYRYDQRLIRSHPSLRRTKKSEDMIRLIKISQQRIFRYDTLIVPIQPYFQLIKTDKWLENAPISWIRG